MTPSGEAGLRRICAVIDLLLDADEEAGLLPVLHPLLLRALPGDSLTWAVRGPAGRHSVHLPADLMDADGLAAFYRHAGSDPLFAHTNTGPGGPVRRSDLQSPAEYRASGTYAEALHPIGAEYQLATAFPAGWTAAGRRTVCLVVHRSAGDFTDADVETALLLRSRLSHALGRLAPPPAPLRSALTAREAAVLDLLAEGLTDGQIARRLAVSARTVDKHLEHAYAKLRVHSRVAAAARWRGAGPGGAAGTGPGQQVKSIR